MCKGEKGSLSGSELECAYKVCVWDGMCCCYLFIYHCMHQHFLNIHTWLPTPVSEMQPGSEYTAIMDSLCVLLWQWWCWWCIWLSIKRRSGHKSGTEEGIWTPLNPSCWGRGPSSNLGPDEVPHSYHGSVLGRGKGDGECNQGAGLPSLLRLCVCVSHTYTQMHSGVEGEEPDRAQCIAGSPTEWLGALSPICS